MNRIPIGGYLIKRSRCEFLFDESLKSHEDWDFLLRNTVYKYWVYCPANIVNIDKTYAQNSNMTQTLGYFWADFTGIYARYPAPHLAVERQKQLRALGVPVSDEMLKFSLRP